MDFLTDSGKSYMIVYHIRPDGDCIGSAYALAVYLQSIGNKVIVIGNDPVPKLFVYQLDEYKDDLTEDMLPDDIIKIVVDSSGPNRIGRFSDMRFDICIDHHEKNAFDAPVKIVDEEAGSCTEILFDLLKDKLANAAQKKKICDLLYMGLITDTNCFRNEAVRPNTFRVAAELADMGADYHGIAQKHALIKSPEQMEMERRLTASYEIYKEYGLVCGILTQQDAREVGVGINMYETLSSLPMIMEDTKLSIVIRELDDGTSRAGIRSRGDISADEIARKFGGGGHFNAAGCSLDMDPREMKDVLTKAAIDYLEHHRTSNY